MAEKITAADYDRWTANAAGFLGLRGEVYPTLCPIAKGQCDDCDLFMGHKVEPPAFVGHRIKFCCGALLPEPTEAAS